MNDCTPQFHEIDRAYKVLSDPHRRDLYDRFGSDGLAIAEDLEQRPDAYDIFLGSHPVVKVFSLLFFRIGPWVAHRLFGDCPLSVSVSLVVL